VLVLCDTRLAQQHSSFQIRHSALQLQERTRVVLFPGAWSLWWALGWRVARVVRTAGFLIGRWGVAALAFVVAAMAAYVPGFGACDSWICFWVTNVGLGPWRAGLKKVPLSGLVPMVSLISFFICSSSSNAVSSWDTIFLPAKSMVNLFFRASLSLSSCSSFAFRNFLSSGDNQVLISK